MMNSGNKTPQLSYSINSLTMPTKLSREVEIYFTLNTIKAIKNRCLYQMTITGAIYSVTPNGI